MIWRCTLKDNLLSTDMVRSYSVLPTPYSAHITAACCAVKVEVRVRFAFRSRLNNEQIDPRAKVKGTIECGLQLRLVWLTCRRLRNNLCSSYLSSHDMLTPYSHCATHVPVDHVLCK